MSLKGDPVLQKGRGRIAARRRAAQKQAADGVAAAYGQVEAQEACWQDEAQETFVDRTPRGGAEDARLFPTRWQLAWPRVRRAAEATAYFAVRMLPGFFLSFADVMGMPSGLHAAYVLAAGCCGIQALPALAGCALALVMRLVWALPVYWARMGCVGLAWGLSQLLRGRGNAWLMLGGAASMLPLALWGIACGSAQEALLCVASMALCALSVPVLLRALHTAHAGAAFDGMETRAAMGWLLCAMVSGGGRMLLGGVNVGVLSASVITCGMAMYCGAAAGMASGLCGGLSLALMGLSPALAIALTLGGMLTGMTRMLDRRWLGCLAFACAALTALLLCEAGGMGCGGAAVLAPLVLLMLRGEAEGKAQRFFHRFLPARPAQGDTYASMALSDWEQTVRGIARAIPSPQLESGSREAAWWQEHLCADCPDRADCEAMLSDHARMRAERVWQHRDSDGAVWQAALEELRGLGCGRLYCLRSGMEHLRSEEAIREAWVKRARYQRDMLVTHLEAVAGAARRFSQLASGESWWDEASAGQLRQRISEAAIPATLLYVRRVQGHACAALEMDGEDADGASAELLRRLCESVLGVHLLVNRRSASRVLLCEKPRYAVCVGISGEGVGEESVTGDAACTCQLSDGRIVAALSDGMGQGVRAGEESGLTVHLLRLCMEAGYTRSQTLTAVNGMLLLETGGERFAAADLVTIDLWSGEATLDKLGSAGSYLMRGSTLAELKGDALPIGILETIESRTCMLRLRPGDRMLLMTDGVEDAFEDPAHLEEAIREALREPYAQTAAESLVRAAAAACSAHPDDRTVMVLQIEKAT